MLNLPLKQNNVIRRADDVGKKGSICLFFMFFLYGVPSDPGLYMFVTAASTIWLQVSYLKPSWQTLLMAVRLKEWDSVRVGESNGKKAAAPVLANTVNKLSQTLFWGGRLRRALAGV